MRRLLSLQICLIALLGACVFDPGGLPAPDVIAPPPPVSDVDAALPPDAPPPPDAAPPADAKELLPPGAACERDEECATAACESFGPLGKQCARPCSAQGLECPLGQECKDDICVPD